MPRDSTDHTPVIRQPNFAVPAGSLGTISAGRRQSIDAGLERASLAADAELRTRGKRLMVPLDAEEIALVLKHLGVKTRGAEAAYVQFALARRFDPASVKRRTQSEMALVFGGGPTQAVDNCHIYTGDGGAKFLCCNIGPFWHCSDFAIPGVP